MTKFEEEYYDFVGYEEAPKNQIQADKFVEKFYTIAENFKDWEPPRKKVAIPKKVAVIIEEGHTLGASLLEFLVLLDKNIDKGTRKWLTKNEQIAVNAWYYGYVIEEESLYRVMFPGMSYPERLCIGYSWSDDKSVHIADNTDCGKDKFTEQEIKAIDERYWEFAVPVEEDNV